MATCAHDAPRVLRACSHLLVAEHAGYIEAFTGRGTGVELVCETCRATSDRTHVVDACAACAELARAHGWDGIVGTPEVVVANAQLRFTRDDVVVPDCPALVDLRPITGADRNRWIGLAADGVLVELDVDARSARTITRVPDLAGPLELHVSEGARFAAVVQRRGSLGAVVELASGRITLPLARGDYHAEQCGFSLAFVERDGRTLVVHATAWNRLEVHDALDARLLTERPVLQYGSGDARPEHYLDYFHCGLAASPDGRWIADGGWVWHPVGIVNAWSIERWLADNPWESEDGASKRQLCWRGYDWDAPMCWIDDTHVAIYGYGEDDEWMIPAAAIYDVTTGARTSWFAGPARGGFAFDRYLYVGSDVRLSAWDLATGARVLDTPFLFARYHPSAKCFAVFPGGPQVKIGRVSGQLARWRSPTIAQLATTIARDRDFAGLVVLGDALEAAGCDDAEVLAHCRAPGPHGEHCWVVDALKAEPLLQR